MVVNNNNHNNSNRNNKSSAPVTQLVDEGADNTTGGERVQIQMGGMGISTV